MWDDKQIVSADWVKQSLAPSVDAGNGWKYGFQWWLIPYGEPQRLAWAALGFGGQHLLVFPDENLILVFTAWNILDDSPIAHDAIQRILPGLHEHVCTSTVH